MGSVVLFRPVTDGISGTVPVVVPPGPVKVTVSPGVAVMVVSVITDEVEVEGAACGDDVLVNVRLPVAGTLLTTRLDCVIWPDGALELLSGREDSVLEISLDVRRPVPAVAEVRGAVEFGDGKGGSGEAP